MRYAGQAIAESNSGAAQPWLRCALFAVAALWLIAMSAATWQDGATDQRTDYAMLSMAEEAADSVDLEPPTADFDKDIDTAAHVVSHRPGSLPRSLGRAPAPRWRDPAQLLRPPILA